VLDVELAAGEVLESALVGGVAAGEVDAGERPRIAGVSSRAGCSFCADHLFIDTSPGRQTMIGPGWWSIV
jgi:hypothetical protein